MKLRLVIGECAYENVISSLSQSLISSEDYVKKSLESECDDFIEAVMDEYLPITESLIGVAYVVCQTQMSNVIAAASALRPHLDQESKKFGAFSEKPYSIIALGHTSCQPGCRTKVELVWALGNYFKHRDEWPYDWDTLPRDKLSKQSRPTVEMLKEVGLGARNSHILRGGLEKLNDGASPNNLLVLVEIVDAWSAYVLDVCTTAAGFAGAPSRSAKSARFPPSLCL